MLWIVASSRAVVRIWVLKTCMLAFIKLRYFEDCTKTTIKWENEFFFKHDTNTVDLRTFYEQLWKKKCRCNTTKM